jgi:hypothetical protein
MNSVRQFGIVVLLLLWLAPAMACIAPDAQLTQQERACCRMMKNQCGQMEMPASHGCCQKDIQSAHHDALKTKPVDIHPDVAATVYLLVAQFWTPGPVFGGRVKHPEVSPPQSPPRSISVLRI